MIELTDAQLGQIESFIDQMLAIGKQTKRDDFRSAYRQGKGAEVAFASFLEEQFDLDAEVDLDVYRGADESDLKSLSRGETTVRRPPVEVKSIPSYGQWVAIPRHNFDRIDQEPIVVVRHYSDEAFEVVGWCHPDDLSLYEQGSRPWTQKGDNWAMPVDQLSTDWNELLGLLSDGRLSPFTFRL